MAESGRQHVRRQSSAYAPANRGSGESEEGPDRSTDGAAEPRPSRPGDRGGTARPAGLLRNNDLADLWGGPSTSCVAQKACSSSGDPKRGSGLPQGHTERGVEESALIFVS